MEARSSDKNVSIIVTEFEIVIYRIDSILRFTKRNIKPA